MGTQSTPPDAVTAGARQRIDLLVLTVAGLALRVPAFLADRHLTFDDGVFGASAVAMRNGGVPFRDVFSSQGPLFLPLVWIGDLLGLRQANSPRLISLVAGLALAALVYLAGRTVTDRSGALLAAGLTTASASILWVTAPIAADGVALAFGSATILLLLRWREDLTVQRAVMVGLCIGATVSVKALAGTVILPVAAVLLAQRRLAPILVGASTAVGLHLALWLPFGPADVWDQAYGYHLEVAGERTPLANLGKTLSTLGDRDLPVLVAAGLALTAVVWARRRLQSVDGILLAWLGTGLAVLLVEHPLWRPHISQLVPPLALLAARHRPPWPVLAAAALAVLPYHAVHSWDVLSPSPYNRSSTEVVEALKALPPGAVAISDDPGIVWRAGRRTTDDLVDASILRIETGRITSASVAETAASDDVCAVVVRSTVRWGSFEDLPDRLARAGYRPELVDDRGRVLYLRDC